MSQIWRLFSLLAIKKSNWVIFIFGFLAVFLLDADDVILSWGEIGRQTTLINKQIKSKKIFSHAAFAFFPPGQKNSKIIYETIACRRLVPKIQSYLFYIVSKYFIVLCIALSCCIAPCYIPEKCHDVQKESWEHCSHARQVCCPYEERWVLLFTNHKIASQNEHPISDHMLGDSMFMFWRTSPCLFTGGYNYIVTWPLYTFVRACGRVGAGDFPCDCSVLLGVHIKTWHHC